ncbi:MAG: DUF2958 domain-containing protein [candidate division Zixibacteria bacterium]|nr:DUF2958 domain-containing protein [candidate division Zixibacteria bacterium]
MMMLTAENKKNLPGLNQTEEIALDDKIVQVKFFCPWGSLTWYAVEYSPEEKLFFGYVCGNGPGCDEWGYFGLDELTSVNGPFGLKIERDMHFPPTKFSEIKS